MKKLILPLILLSTLFLAGCKFAPAEPKVKLLPPFEECFIKEIVADGQGRCNVLVSYNNSTFEKGTYYYFYYSDKKIKNVNDDNLHLYGLSDGSDKDKIWTYKFSYNGDTQEFYDAADTIYLYIRYSKGYYPDATEDYTWSKLSSPIVLKKSDVPKE